MRISFGTIPLAFGALLISSLYATATHAQTLPTYTVNPAVYSKVNSCITRIAHEIADQRRLRIIRNAGHRRIDQGRVPEVHINIRQAQGQISNQMQNTANQIAAQIQAGIAAKYVEVGFPMCALIKGLWLDEAVKKCSEQSALNQYWAGIQQGCSQKTGNEHRVCQCVAPEVFQALIGVCTSLVRSQGMADFVAAQDRDCKLRATSSSSSSSTSSAPPSSQPQSSSPEAPDSSASSASSTSSASSVSSSGDVSSEPTTSIVSATSESTSSVSTSSPSSFNSHTLLDGVAVPAEAAGDFAAG